MTLTINQMVMKRPDETPKVYCCGNGRYPNQHKRHFFAIHFNVTRPRKLKILKCPFPSDFRIKLLLCIPPFLLSPIPAIWPAYLTLFALIVLIIFGEDQKLWSSSSRNYLHPPVTSSPQPPQQIQIFSSAPCSQASSLNARDQDSHPHKTDKIRPCYIGHYAI
jgi:hypothetical protein